MRKNIRFDVEGSRKDLFNFDIFCRMVRDYNRLGVPPLKAAKLVVQLLEMPPVKKAPK